MAVVDENDTHRVHLQVLLRTRILPDIEGLEGVKVFRPLQETEEGDSELFAN